AGKAVDAVAALLTDVNGGGAGPSRAVRSAASKPIAVRHSVSADAAGVAGVEVRASAALAGVVASPGLAAGQAVWFATREIDVQEAGAGVSYEAAQLDHAKAQVRTRLEAAHAAASG